MENISKEFLKEEAGINKLRDIIEQLEDHLLEKRENHEAEISNITAVLETQKNLLVQIENMIDEVGDQS